MASIQIWSSTGPWHCILRVKISIKKVRANISSICPTDQSVADYPPSLFRQAVRLTADQFNTLHELIKDSADFDGDDKQLSHSIYTPDRSPDSLRIQERNRQF